MARTPLLQVVSNPRPQSNEQESDAVVDASKATLNSRTKELDFEAVFEAHFSYVWHTLARLGIGEADREDLANEVFFQVHRRFQTVDLRLPLRPWIFAFAFRIASTHRRLARHRFERVGDLPDATDSAPSPDEALERREAQSIVDRALDELELEQRAVFVLHEIDGYPVPEIATALAIPLNTAYSRLRLARVHFTAKVRWIKNLERRP
jgi:RNA polymerase sigma-70 factor, ECF subfamily